MRWRKYVRRYRAVKRAVLVCCHCSWWLHKALSSPLCLTRNSFSRTYKETLTQSIHSRRTKPSHCASTEPPSKKTSTFESQASQPPNTQPHCEVLLFLPKQGKSTYMCFHLRKIHDCQHYQDSIKRCYQHSTKHWICHPRDCARFYIVGVLRSINLCVMCKSRVPGYWLEVRGCRSIGNFRGLWTRGGWVVRGRGVRWLGSWGWEGGEGFALTLENA